MKKATLKVFAAHHEKDITTSKKIGILRSRVGRWSTGLLQVDKETVIKSVGLLYADPETAAKKCKSFRGEYENRL